MSGHPQDAVAYRVESVGVVERAGGAERGPRQAGGRLIPGHHIVHLDVPGHQPLDGARVRLQLFGRMIGAGVGAGSAPQTPAQCIEVREAVVGRDREAVSDDAVGGAWGTDRETRDAGRGGGGKPGAEGSPHAGRQGRCDLGVAGEQFAPETIDQEHDDVAGGNDGQGVLGNSAEGAGDGWQHVGQGVIHGLPHGHQECRRGGQG